MPDASQVRSRRNNLNSSDCLALPAHQSEQFRLFGFYSGGCEKRGCAGRSGCTKLGVPDKCTPETAVGAVLSKSIRLFDHPSFRAVGVENIFQSYLSEAPHVVNHGITGVPEALWFYSFCGCSAVDVSWAQISGFQGSSNETDLYFASSLARRQA